MTTTGTQPLMVVDDRDDAVFTSLGNSRGFRRVINRIDEVSDNTTEKGDLFEKVVKAFIEQDGPSLRCARPGASASRMYGAGTTGRFGG